MKKNILGTVLLMACFFLAIGISVRPAFSQEEEPMTPFELDETSWAVEIKNDTEYIGSDNLVFEEGKFFSEKFKDDGFKPTNHSLSVLGDGSTVFKTMQNSEEKTLYWKGTIKDNKISGKIDIFSKEENGVREKYYFIGELKSGVLERKPYEEPVALEEPKTPSSEMLDESRNSVPATLESGGE